MRSRSTRRRYEQAQFFDVFRDRGNRKMTAAFDLDAYFERIRWNGDTSLSLETLGGLVQAHMRHIPFENLDVLLGRPVRLDLDSLQQKLVRARRGGYCFEHMTLFAAAIEALGFQPVPHSARVLLTSARENAPRTHMFLTVAVADGVYVLDPGFGGPAPMFPVPLVDCGARPTRRIGCIAKAMTGSCGTTWATSPRMPGFRRSNAIFPSISKWPTTLRRRIRVRRS
jgi:hypothetical protein